MAANSRSLTSLKKFIDANPGIDFETAQLHDQVTQDSYNWKGLAKARPKVIKQLQAYQRLYKLLPQPEPAHIMGLLALGIESALQVAAMSEDRFRASCGELLAHDEAYLSRVYARAKRIRAQVLATYLQYQQHHEPHARQSVVTP